MNISLTAHAVDRASTRLATNWRKTRTSTDEGIHSWLERVAVAAWAERERRNNHNPSIAHNGIRFVFAIEHATPVLMTVLAEPKPQRPR